MEKLILDISSEVIDVLNAKSYVIRCQWYICPILSLQLSRRGILNCHVDEKFVNFQSDEVLPPLNYPEFFIKNDSIVVVFGDYQPDEIRKIVYDSVQSAGFDAYHIGSCSVSLESVSLNVKAATIKNHILGCFLNSGWKLLGNVLIRDSDRSTEENNNFNPNNKEIPASFIENRYNECNNSGSALHQYILFDTEVFASISSKDNITVPIEVPIVLQDAAPRRSNANKCGEDTAKSVSPAHNDLDDIELDSDDEIELDSDDDSISLAEEEAADNENREKGEHPTTSTTPPVPPSETLDVVATVASLRRMVLRLTVHVGTIRLQQVSRAALQKGFSFRMSEQSDEDLLPLQQGTDFDGLSCLSLPSLGPLRLISACSDLEAALQRVARLFPCSCSGSAEVGVEIGSDCACGAGARRLRERMQRARAVLRALGHVPPLSSAAAENQAEVFLVCASTASVRTCATDPLDCPSDNFSGDFFRFGADFFQHFSSISRLENGVDEKDNDKQGEKKWVPPQGVNVGLAWGAGLLFDAVPVLHASRRDRALLLQECVRALVAVGPVARGPDACARVFSLIPALPEGLSACSSDQSDTADLLTKSYDLSAGFQPSFTLSRSIDAEASQDAEANQDSDLELDLDSDLDLDLDSDLDLEMDPATAPNRKPGGEYLPPSSKASTLEASAINTPKKEAPPSFEFTSALRMTQTANIEEPVLKTAPAKKKRVLLEERRPMIRGVNIGFHVKVYQPAEKAGVNNNKENAAPGISADPKSVPPARNTVSYADLFRKGPTGGRCGLSKVSGLQNAPGFQGSAVHTATLRQGTKVGFRVGKRPYLSAPQLSACAPSRCRNVSRDTPFSRWLLGDDRKGTVERARTRTPVPLDALYLRLDRFMGETHTPGVGVPPSALAAVFRSNVLSLSDALPQDARGWGTTAAFTAALERARGAFGASDSFVQDPEGNLQLSFRPGECPDDPEVY